MKCSHGAMQFELPDQWWEEAGMEGFAPSRPAFRPDPTVFPGLPVLEVAIADVEPADRQLSHGVFNDSPSAGSARQRVVSILRGFRDGAAIPPVELVRLAPGGPYEFRLYHGVHRFYCAVAVGFSAVAAVDVTTRRAENVDLDAG